MSGNQPGINCGESMVLGVELFAPISSVAGSSALIFTQPLLTGNVFQSSAVVIGAQIILLIAHHFFGVRSVPALDLKNNQTVQLPLSELQDFLRWMNNGANSSNLSSIPNGSNGLVNAVSEAPTGLLEDRGFRTPQLPETPIVIAIYIIGNFSNKPYTPIVEIIFPIFTFPGLRGALPLLIVGLLATIFVRSVVPPETTGSRPLTKPDTSTNNTPLTFTPNDLLQLLTKFGKHFSS
ncbi:hypothetical protein [Desulfosporosinus sp.]|uniref:hypothetical protein n=1 Tax=Desulfosporosinus sp. TaxID=157907 RepID=UPI0025C3112C|nr:hypothetical protein [Desulfosporosinus sp.]MBC2724567.1 hypothetical protein [Desulfosporosinus sp.]MBC2725381.1 hypothetical protein [Desulfosporosinus sp.]